MKKTRRIFSVICAIALLLGSATTAFAGEPVAVIYYTNDIHGAYENMAKVAYLAETEGAILVDAGDAIQGSIASTLTKGQAMVDVMKAMGYDVNIPGNHEYDFGMDRFLDIAEDGGLNYICSNFVELTGIGDRAMMDGYTIVDADGDPTTEDDQIGFVGVLTPLTVSSSTPAYFQDDQGNWKYGFLADGTGEAMYLAVQNAIDAVKADGADYVIAVGHLGVVGDVYTSTALIRNTSGLDAVIDGHSHTIMDRDIVFDRDGNDVVLTQTGTKLEQVGRLVIGADGTIDSRLIEVGALTEVDPEVQAVVDDITKEVEAVSLEVVAKSDVDLVINDPVTGQRLVRSTETNLGNLVTDAYRTLLGTDVGLTNGGGVRANIKAGDITNGDIISVHPFGNSMCSAEVTGQQLLDALEAGAMNYPEENGSFLQVSGLSYEIHSYIPSGVKMDENGIFLGVDGDYRVKNVLVGGEPLDVTKTYSVGSHDYMLQSGAYSMFDDTKILRDEVMPDNEILIRYITETLGGNVTEEAYGNPYGEGRISIVTEAPMDPQTVVTREQAVQMIYELEQEMSGGKDPADKIEEAISWAKETGIAAGYTDGTFGENDPVSRQQMATFLFKYAKYKGVDVSVGEDTNILSYEDFMEISEYAFPSLQWACGAGVMKGHIDGTLDPRGTIIYSEAQWMVKNYKGM
ncbi:MAG: 5'-nucleotidase C-terminal domain-containing protein [Firmicutes bacterium]|nr:5'-nucleotidase C-terminal domain-containing protein [Bacillota bacterium]